MVDGGGLLFKATTITPELIPQEKAAAAGIAEAYRLMRYDAVGIAAQDLAAGLPFLQHLATRTQVPWLSADLIHRGNGKTLFAPFITKKVGTLTVGIFSLAGPKAAAALRPEDQAMVQPWQGVVPRVLEQLKKADLIILLSGLPAAENATLAQRYPGLHIIVQAGDERAGNQPPRQVNNTLFLQTEKQGKHLGVLDIQWNRSKRWGENQTKQLAGIKSELDRTRWFIRSHQRKGDPAVLYQNDPGRLKIYQELVIQEQRFTEEVKRLEKEVAQGAGLGNSLATNRFLELTTDLPDQPAVQAIVDQTTKTMNRLGQELAKSQLAQTKNHTADQRPHVGWLRCAECHRTEADFWRQSRHAKAYETLRGKNQHFNQTCLPCHVTGPASITMPAHLQAVGCESCHGPGRDHSADPKQPITKQPPAQSCLGCHTPEQDDNFDYARDRTRLNCIHVHP